MFSEYVVYCSMLVVAYPYACYPLLLFLLGPFLSARYRFADRPISCTIVISARNSEWAIRERLSNCLSQSYPPDKLQVLVADDASTDRTLSIVRSFQDERVTLVTLDRQRGKNAAINAAAASARGEVLVFSDANTRFRHDAVKQLVAHFADPRIGCVCGRLRYERAQAGLGRGEQIYSLYEHHLKRLEGRLGQLLGANGAIFAVRKELFEPLRPEVPNDLQTPNDAVARGYWAVYEPSAEAVEQALDEPGASFARKVRIVARGLASAFGVAPRMSPFRLWILMSHKVLRWLGPCFLIVAFLTSAFSQGSLVLRAIFFAQLAIYLVGLIGVVNKRSKSPLLTLPAYFLTIQAGVIVGLVLFLKGTRFTTWTPTANT